MKVKISRQSLLSLSLGAIKNVWQLHLDRPGDVTLKSAWNAFITWQNGI
jgi:hypothetical protein